ncbi:PAS domain-containing sensor histidine kinase [Sphingomonas parva]|uniref:histidine kinase n=1 Tax=Sphingomonas parva TaxID=2555898 RepID=A0A4Y8ZK43_9SPHN|nr:ATP-binding protein [Sphingomonas parva]TFI56348.1 PAS domain-containing sensor histidine kinase [Sphingomonas parva]
MADTAPKGGHAILDFKEIADATPSLIWVSNARKEGVWFNRTWLEYTGATLEEELGEGWLRRICPEDVGAIDECVRAFAEQRPFRTEFRLRRADGCYRWMIDTGVPRFSADGAFEGFVGSLVDIEDRKVAEEQRNLLSNGLQPSRLATMTAMASAFAHELNQPLAAICNYIRAARRIAGEGNPRLIEPLHAAETCAMRAGDIIRGMRATVSRASPAGKRVDLRALVRESLLLAELTMGRRNGIAVDVPAGTAVHVDAVKIQQVLVNLLRNAVEASAGQAAPRVAIVAAREAEHVRISVEDNGPGFPEAQGRARFEPFRTTKATGLGLGLPICQNIVEAHGGRLWVDATSAAGTRVCFTVPKDPPAQDRRG